MGNTLIDLSNELAGIVHELSPFIVSVRARRHYPSSGLLWNAGVVVTADHAVQRDEDIAVTLADGKSVEATLIGRDPGTDLAVLRVEASSSSVVEPVRADAVKAGELTLVLGRSPESGINAGFVPRGYLGIGVQPVLFPEELQKKLSISQQGGPDRTHRRFQWPRRQSRPIDR